MSTPSIFNVAEQRRRLNFLLIVAGLCLLGVSTWLGITLPTRLGNEHRSSLQAKLEKQLEFRVEQLRAALKREAERPFTEYSHAHLSRVDLQSFLKFSNIASPRPNVEISGLVGFFEIGSKGRLELPFFPDSPNFAVPDRDLRQNLAQDLFNAFRKTQPVNAAQESIERYQQLFGGLWLPQSFRLAQNADSSKKLGTKPLPPLSEAPASKTSAKKSKGEINVDVGLESRTQASLAQAFPLEAFVLDSGFIVIFRSVLHQGRNLRQGFLLNAREFLKSFEVADATIPGLQTSALLSGDVLSLSPIPQANAERLAELSLPTPLDDLQILLTANSLSWPNSLKINLGLLLLGLILLLITLGLIFRNAHRQLDLLEQQNNFVSAVSHELRTPLTAIRLHSEMLQLGWSRSESDRQKAYTYIQSESERLSRLIDNILQIARLGRTSSALKLESLSPQEIECMTREKALPLAQAQGYEFSLANSAEHRLNVMLDRDALTQILMNLVDNSLKFSRDCTPRRIEIQIQNDATHLSLEVRDFGPGMPESVRARAFDIFYRAEDELTRRTTGTGIGLALVKHLADQMHAQIEILPATPGTKVRLRWPIGSRPPDQAPPS
jgi:two-component system phosphate regulon sensor histidine kinase PhoR